MARTIEVEYIIKDAEGKEVARFQSLDDAKQYDKMLTAAEDIYDLLGNIKELDSVKDAVKDDISFQLAKHADEVLSILSNIATRKKSPKKEKSVADNSNSENNIEELKEAV